jgi:hypothetical protein
VFVDTGHHGTGKHVHDNTASFSRTFSWDRYVSLFDSNFVPNTFVASTYRNQLNSFMAAM